MTDETQQRLQDAEEHRKDYEGIMGASIEVGVPFAMGITMFFTQLVMANGVLFGVLAAIATYVFVYLIVKTFFSH